jgi:hypothetical protein
VLRVNGSEDVRLIRLRYASRCVVCAGDLQKGDEAWWERASRKVTCQSCREPEPVSEAPADVEPDVGQAGGSAEREYGRRRTNREQRVLRAHPRLGRFLLAVSGEPQSTRAWKAGAEGERKVAARLDPLVEEGIAVLHDRRIPGSKANVDHVVVAPSGIHVIDSKRYTGKVHTRNKGGLLRSDVRLYVGSRDRTKLVDAMARQVLAVDEAAGDLVGDPPTPITPVLCFVGADWPAFSKSMSLQGVRITWPRELVKLLRRPGPLDVTAIDQLATRLIERLPPA